MSVVHANRPSKVTSGLEALLTVREVAAVLRRSRQSVYQLAHEKPEVLGVVRLGRTVRFRRSAIERLVSAVE